MAKRNQHVVPLGNGWAVKGEGSRKFTVITETQRDAITVARGIAKNNHSQIVIHRKDGSKQNVTVTLRVDSPIEVEYLKHGGILPFVLRELMAA